MAENWEKVLNCNIIQTMQPIPLGTDEPSMTWKFCPVKAHERTDQAFSSLHWATDATVHIKQSCLTQTLYTLGSTERTRKHIVMWSLLAQTLKDYKDTTLATKGRTRCPAHFGGPRSWAHHVISFHISEVLVV